MAPGGSVSPTRRGWSVSLLLVLFVYLAVTPIQSPIHAQPLPVPEPAVKAAYLCNFPSFTSWPEQVFPQTNSPFVIAILGEDPFGRMLDKAAQDKLVDGHLIEIKRWKNLREFRQCHLLFISSSENPRLQEILRRVANLPILTVGDSDGFAAAGGIIGLKVEARRVGFEINLPAADKANLKLQAKLLKLANVIRGPEQPK